MGTTRLVRSIRCRSTDASSKSRVGCLALVSTGNCSRTPLRGVATSRSRTACWYQEGLETAGYHPKVLSKLRWEFFTAIPMRRKCLICGRIRKVREIRLGECARRDRLLISLYRDTLIAVANAGQDSPARGAGRIPTAKAPAKAQAGQVPADHSRDSPAGSVGTQEAAAHGLPDLPAPAERA
jgi:hypothetical protein